MKDSIASVVAQSMTKMTNFLNEKMRSRPEMVVGEEPQERQNQIKVIAICFCLFDKESNLSY